MNLYRVKYGMQDGGASWGDWKYFEDEERLLVDLVNAQLDIDYAGTSNHKNWFKMMVALAFRKRMADYDPLDTEHFRQIYAVEQAVDNEWVERKFHYQEPKVWIE